MGSDLQGLSADEARRRLTTNGPNAVDGPQSTEALRLLAHQFASPLVLILVLAAAVSLFLHNWSDAAIILTIVLGSTLLGFTQVYRASNAVAALRERLALTSRVRRDGQVQVLPAQQMVCGDLVKLAAGNLVPADGVLIEARDLMLSEASLTGESFPVEKQVGPCAANAAPNARDNSVFLGTSVRSGSGVMLITATGHDTEVGAVAMHLGATEPPPEFERGIAAFGGLLLRVMVVMVLLVMTINTAQGRARLRERVHRRQHGDVAADAAAHHERDRERLVPHQRQVAQKFAVECFHQRATTTTPTATTCGRCVRPAAPHSGPSVNAACQPLRRACSPSSRRDVDGMLSCLRHGAEHPDSVWLAAVASGAAIGSRQGSSAMPPYFATPPSAQAPDGVLPICRCPATKPSKNRSPSPAWPIW